MAVTQSHYRFGIDELAESTHGWLAAEDTSGITRAPASTFLLRFTLQCDGTLLSNIDAEFQVRKNGGAYQNITTASTIVKAVTTVAFANGDNTTKRLSGTGTFETTSAGCTEDGISGGTAFDIVANGNGETECALQVVDADVAGGDLLEFRLTRDGGTLLDTYAVTPSLLVNKAVTFTAGAPTVTLSAPAAVLLAPAVLVAGAPVVTISAPTATLIDAGGDQTLVAGAPLVTLSAPTATLIADALLLAGAPTVTLFAPAAVLLAPATLLAGAPTVTVTAPQATLVVDGGGGPSEIGYGGWQSAVLAACALLTVRL